MKTSLRKVYRALDLFALAAVAQKQGKSRTAAKLLAKAAEAPDFEAAATDIMRVNDTLATASKKPRARRGKKSLATAMASLIEAELEDEDEVFEDESMDDGDLDGLLDEDDGEEEESEDDEELDLMEDDEEESEDDDNVDLDDLVNDEESSATKRRLRKRGRSNRSALR